MIKLKENLEWKCWSCHEFIVESEITDPESTCPHCGKKWQFFIHRDFKIKATGGFFSNDGYIIIEIPDWVPEEYRSTIFKQHFQSGILCSYIDQCWGYKEQEDEQGKNDNE